LTQTTPPRAVIGELLRNPAKRTRCGAHQTAARLGAA
jgi:hypothetical protein